MEEKRIIKKYLAINTLILLVTPFWLEGLMGLNRKMNIEFGYGGKLNYKLYESSPGAYTILYKDFEQVVFPVNVIFVLLVTGVIHFIFNNNYISENKFKQLFKYDLLYRVLLIALFALTIYQFNLTDFWDEHIALYRIMYLVSLALSVILIYEFTINRGTTIFKGVSHGIKQQNIISEEKKLTSLKELNIISEQQFSEEAKKIRMEKILVEIRNTKDYNEFVSNLDFAVSKGLITNDEKQTKLLDKEKELMKQYIT